MQLKNTFCTKKNSVMVSAAIAMLCIAQSGCFSPSGALYTRVTQPLSLPTHRMDCPIAHKSCHVSLTQLKEPVSRINLSVMWSDNVVKEAARDAGITEIYYTDLETLSIVLGSYQRRRVIFYGN